jgi:hypothetical protein
MSRDQLSRRCRRLLERLSQPSSAAGLAALLALWCRSSRQGSAEIRHPLAHP